MKIFDCKNLLNKTISQPNAQSFLRGKKSMKLKHMFLSLAFVIFAKFNDKKTIKESFSSRLLID